MRERHLRETETRGGRILQERGPQYEHRVGGADAIEWCVECGGEEWIPERPPLARPLMVALQPRLERLVAIALRHCREQRAPDARLLAQRKMRVAGERRKQMQRRGQRAAYEVPDSPVAREDRCLEALLQMQLLFHADARGELDELVAAGQEDVLAVIDLDAVDLKRRCPAAKKPAAFEELDAKPGIFQVKGRRETGKPGAGDRYALDSHDLTTTGSCSLLESAARARKGSPGSRSIFLRSSS